MLNFIIHTYHMILCTFYWTQCRPNLMANEGMAQVPQLVKAPNQCLSQGLNLMSFILFFFFVFVYLIIVVLAVIPLATFFFSPQSFLNFSTEANKLTNRIINFIMYYLLRIQHIVLLNNYLNVPDLATNFFSKLRN